MGSELNYCQLLKGVDLTKIVNALQLLNLACASKMAYNFISYSTYILVYCHKGKRMYWNIVCGQQQSMPHQWHLITNFLWCFKYNVRSMCKLRHSLMHTIPLICRNLQIRFVVKQIIKFNRAYQRWRGNWNNSSYCIK